MPSTSEQFDDNEQHCVALYDFFGSNDGELTIHTGQRLIVAERDTDGHGWTRVIASKEQGEEEGYVPTSYLKFE